MTKLPLTLAIRNYDYIGPLACGDVTAEGIDLKLDRDNATAMERAATDPSIQAGERSFSRHLLGLVAGDRSFIGIPIFTYCGFRHRCFYIRRNSNLRDFKDLEGKRIGLDAWPATGNTWCRAAMREQGVSIERIRWWVGPLDRGAPDQWTSSLPAYVQPVAPGQTLRNMLLAGELDALMLSYVPKGFYEPDSPLVRLYPDYRHVEQEYYRRTGVYPVFHIVAIRRETFERYPWVARSLYLALDRSRAIWQETRREFAETTPWALADMEEASALMGGDWQPNGVEPNLRAMQTLCDEQFAQGLSPKRLDATTVFTEFEQVMKG